MTNVNYRCANDSRWVVNDLVLGHHIKLGHCQHANTYAINKWHGHLQCTGFEMWGVVKTNGVGIDTLLKCVPPQNRVKSM